MHITKTAIEDVLLLTPQIFQDERGYLFETFQQQTFAKDTGKDYTFVQDNQVFSKQYVLRGLHYQIQNPQGKLIHAIQGEIFDVAVDMRTHSKTFGQYITAILSEKKQEHLFIPPGFAHGFLVLSAAATIIYKMTDYWSPKYERTLAWDDPDLAIPWPLENANLPILSIKDREGRSWHDAEKFT